MSVNLRSDAKVYRVRLLFFFGCRLFFVYKGADVQGSSRFCRSVYARRTHKRAVFLRKIHRVQRFTDVTPLSSTDKASSCVRSPPPSLSIPTLAPTAAVRTAQQEGYREEGGACRRLIGVNEVVDARGEIELYVCNEGGRETCGALGFCRVYRTTTMRRRLYLIASCGG